MNPVGGASSTASTSGAAANSTAEELSFTTLTTATGANAQYVLEARRDSQELDGAAGGLADDDGETPHELREQDRFLPIANVARIMKKSIPSTQGKIAKDARECVQECVSEFISFITSEASDRCQAEKRKTINGEDILFAMSTLGFDNYVEPLKLYLQKYRESTKGDKANATGGALGAEGGEFVDRIGEDDFATMAMASSASGTGQGEAGQQQQQLVLAYPTQQQF